MNAINTGHSCLKNVIALFFVATLMVFPVPGRAQDEASITSASSDLTTTMASCLMKFYCFRDIDDTSSVIKIKIKDTAGEYKMYVDGLSVIKMYSEVDLWWPGCRESEIDRKRILEEGIYPAIEHGFSVFDPNTRRMNGLSQTVFITCLQMKGLRKPWFLDIRNYSQQVTKIRASNPVDPIPELVESQGRARQNIQVNDMILANIQSIYPKMNKPWGVYLAYWQDPSDWD